MPYLKRQQRYRKKRLYRNKRALVNTVMKLKNKINVEFKHKDTAVTSNISNTLQRILINGMSKGDDIGTRDARKIRIKSIQIKGMITFTDQTAGLATGASVVRVMLILDKQANGATPTALQILEIDSINSLKNNDNKNRFVILMDRTYKRPDSVASGVNQLPLEYYKRVNIITQYNSSDTGTITDINTNSLYLVSIADRHNATYPLEQDRNVRIKYIDN